MSYFFPRNKRGMVSRTIILVSLVVFSIFVNLFYTAYRNTQIDIDSGYVNPDTGIKTTDISHTSSNNVGLGEFFLQFVIGFKEAPLWLNVVFLLINYLAVFLLITAFLPLTNAGN